VTEPRGNESDIKQAIQQCGVQLTKEENWELTNFIYSKRDARGFVDIIALLAAIGLPA